MLATQVFIAFRKKKITMKLTKIWLIKSLKKTLMYEPL